MAVKLGRFGGVTVGGAGAAWVSAAGFGEGLVTFGVVVFFLLLQVHGLFVQNMHSKLPRATPAPSNQ